MKHAQLMFGGEVHVEPPKPRAGAIGKVERLIEERPWLTCGEIAEATKEPSSRVSECLNKLKIEGKAQRERGLGEHRKWVWAGTSEAGCEAREVLLRGIVAESDARTAALAGERLRKAFRRIGASYGPEASS